MPRVRGRVFSVILDDATPLHASNAVPRATLTLHRQELGFELDPFFEPHVVAWIRDTEDIKTHEWVSRAVGMDSVGPISFAGVCILSIDLVGTGRREQAQSIGDRPVRFHPRFCRGHPARSSLERIQASDVPQRSLQSQPCIAHLG